MPCSLEVPITLRQRWGQNGGRQCLPPLAFALSESIAGMHCHHRGTSLTSICTLLFHKLWLQGPDLTERADPVHTQTAH